MAAQRNADQTDSPIRITREYGPPLPRRSLPSGNMGSKTNNNVINARTLGAAHPQGQRLELSPEVKARIAAARRKRGLAASQSVGMLRRTSGMGPTTQQREQAAGSRSRRRRGNRGFLENDDADRLDEASGPAVSFSPWEEPPRQTHDHVPENLKLEDLHIDWPTVPSGKIGMVETVSSKLRWMARRMQHGYDTPHELAQRMHRGEMVQFQSDKEKQEVLKLAKELAEKRADRLLERKGEQVSIRDPSFKAVAEGDRDFLANEFVKGIYSPTAESPANKKENTKKQSGSNQQHSLLSHVDSILANNHTYRRRDREQLLSTIGQVFKRGPAPGATGNNAEAP